jgi:hypothetical protein
MLSDEVVQEFRLAVDIPGQQSARQADDVNPETASANWLHRTSSILSFSRKSLLRAHTI